MLPAEVQKLVENEYARTSIRVKAKQLSRRKNFGSSCREDIEQDLWLHLLGQAARFDGDRSSLNTFIDRVVNSAAASLVRSREGEKKHPPSRAGMRNRGSLAVVHEHVVPIHNVETERDAPFLVMQYIPGESLQSRIDRTGPLQV